MYFCIKKIHPRTIMLKVLFSILVEVTKYAGAYKNINFFLNLISRKSYVGEGTCLGPSSFFLLGKK